MTTTQAKEVYIWAPNGIAGKGPYELHIVTSQEELPQRTGSYVKVNLKNPPNADTIEKLQAILGI